METAYSQKLPRTFSGLIFSLKIESLPKVITNQRLFRSIVFTSDRFNRTSPSLKKAITQSTILKRDRTSNSLKSDRIFIHCINLITFLYFLNKEFCHFL
jgi:hypothetical protein